VRLPPGCPERSSAFGAVRLKNVKVPKVSKDPGLYAYVDETGDRGSTGKSSRFFAMSAVIVPKETVSAMRSMVDTCRNKLGVPAGKALHWKDHAKTFPRRQFLSETFAGLPDISVNYVIFEKASMSSGSAVFNNHFAFYNVAAGAMLLRILLAADRWPGGRRDVRVKFSHSRGCDVNETLACFERLRAIEPPETLALWEGLQGNVKFPSVGQYDGLQAADVYAGMLSKAI
jgi:Protein of unknown function (DUF3800)